MMMMMDRNFIQDLPEVARNRILFYLTSTELITFSKCCKNFRQYANQDNFWKYHCTRDGLKNYEFLHEKSSHPCVPLKSSATTISPIFIEIDSDTLIKLCKLQLVYIKSKHLIKNWRNGNYTIAPILRGHKGRISTFDSDGEIIVSGSSDEKIIKAWSIQDCECLYTIKSNVHSINSIKIYKSYFLSGSDDGFIRVYDKVTGEMKNQLSANNSISKLFIVGELLVAICNEKSIRVWSLEKFQLMYILRDHEEEIECFNSFKNYGVSGSWDNKIILWDIKNGKKYLTLVGHSEVINCLKMRYGVIVSGSSDASVRIWNISIQEHFERDEKTKNIINKSKAECDDVKTLIGHESDVYCLDFNSYYIASSGADSKIIIWNFEGDLIHSLNGHLGVVRYLFIDENKLVSGGDAKKINVWDFRDGKLLNTLHRNPNRLHLMWLDETKIITASPENESSLVVVHYW